jgi:WD40 repeat protein
MWDLKGMSLVKTFMGHSDSVTCCCLTPDGQKLITGSLDQSVRVWDIAQGSLHISYPFASQVYVSLSNPRYSHSGFAHWNR